MNVCPECGCVHHPNDAHSRYSDVYQLNFLVTHGRFPRWADAIAHCPPEIKAWWERELLGMRVDPGEFASEEPE